VPAQSSVYPYHYLDVEHAGANASGRKQQHCYESIALGHLSSQPSKGSSHISEFAIVNMDQSIGWMMNTLELCHSNLPEEHVPLVSTIPTLSMKSDIFIQSVYTRIGNQEIELSASVNSLRPTRLSHMDKPKLTSESHDERQPSASGITKLGPLRRKCHAKSRRGCYNCKKRHVKVHLTLLRKTKEERLRCIIVSREPSNMHSMRTALHRV
jgi:hypothetical protein